MTEYGAFCWLLNRDCRHYADTNAGNGTYCWLLNTECIGIENCDKAVY